MPELPEVEVVRLFLADHLVGKKITNLTVLTQKSFIGDPTQVIGQTIRSFCRIGKQLSIHLSNNLILLVHLKMTGQLIYVNNNKSSTALGHPAPDLSVPNKSTRVVIRFAPLVKGGSGGILYFNDQRKFGWIKVLSQDKLAESQKTLGVDILSPKFTSKYFYSQIHSFSRPIKLLLLDQSKLAGVGNIYANDALFLAGLHPQTPSSKITPIQSQKLRRSLLKVMRQSILHGGSTAKDNQYLRPDQTAGSHQFHFLVYQRTGQPCLSCATPIHRLVIGGRGTFFCPKCQKPS